MKQNIILHRDENILIAVKYEISFVHALVLKN